MPRTGIINYFYVVIGPEDICFGFIADEPKFLKEKKDHMEIWSYAHKNLSKSISNCLKLSINIVVKFTILIENCHNKKYRNNNSNTIVIKFYFVKNPPDNKIIIFRKFSTAKIELKSIVTYQYLHTLDIWPINKISE